MCTQGPASAGFCVVGINQSVVYCIQIVLNAGGRLYSHIIYTFYLELAPVRRHSAQSMTIKENISLAGLTTFRIGGPARFFCAVGTPGELEEAAAFAKGKSLPIFILGGGSNILVSDKGFDGLVIKIEIKGIEEFENKGGILVKAGAGEDWDAFVKWTVERGLGGLENLSLIPGTVGAAPVQNIGAYGAEVAGLIESVEAYDLREGAFKTFKKEDCGFAYRDSMFKREKGRYA